MAIVSPFIRSATLRAAIYTRVSTPGQEERSSLDTQLASCRQYADDRGYRFDETHLYREVHTGVELWERPALQRLRAAIRQRQIDVVIVHAIDRLARDPVHLGVILSEADHAGVAVEFVTEVLDDSPEGQLIRFVRGYAAKIEHEKIRERAMRGVRDRVASGYPLAGKKAPYGYRWLPDILDMNGKPLVVKPGLEEDPLTAPIARRIFDAVAAGTTLRSLAMQLSAEGITTPTGRPNWQHTTLRAILGHPVYIGQPKAFRLQQHTIRTSEGRKKVKRPRPEAEQSTLPPGTAPALIDANTFAVVAEQLRTNKLRATRNNRHPERSLLRGGFIRCGYCGAAMIARQAKILRYRCGASLQANSHCDFNGGIAAAQIDAAVLNRIEAVLDRPEIVEQELARMLRDDSTETDLAAIDREIAKISYQQENLVEQIANVRGSAATLLVGKLATLETARERLLAEREGILGRRRVWMAAQQQYGGLVQWCKRVRARLRTDTYEGKRQVLEAFAVKVLVWRADHEPQRYLIELHPMLNGIAAGAEIVDKTADSSSARPAGRSRTPGPRSASRR